MRRVLLEESTAAHEVFVTRCFKMEAVEALEISQVWPKYMEAINLNPHAGDSFFHQQEIK